MDVLGEMKKDYEEKKAARPSESGLFEIWLGGVDSLFSILTSTLYLRNRILKLWKSPPLVGTRGPIPFHFIELKCYKIVYSPLPILQWD